MLSIGSQINEVRIDGDLERLLADLESFRSFGLAAAEISAHGIDAIRNGRLDWRRTAEVRSILNRFPFRYSVHAPNSLNLMEHDQFDLHIEVLRASLEFTREIGGEVLVVHPGRYLVEEAFAVTSPFDPPEAEKERLREREAEAVGRVAEEFPEVIIGLENARPYLHHSPYCYAEIPAELARQVRRIGRRNVRITLDLGHLYMAARFYRLDPVREAAAVADLVGHIHVHDNFGEAVYYSEKQQTHQLPFGRGDSHMPPGWGDIPLAALLEKLPAAYRGLLIIELRSRYFSATGEAARNLRVLLTESQAPSSSVQQAAAR